MKWKMKSGCVSPRQWSVPLSLFLAWLFLLVATRNPACDESSSHTCLALASASTLASTLASASTSASASRSARFQSRAEKSGAFRARIAAADRSESERENDGESRWVCLRSTTPRGEVSLRTLREHRGSRRYALRGEEEETTTTTTTTTRQRSDFRPARGETRDIASVDSEFLDWCWQSVRNNNTTPTNDNGRLPPRNEPEGNKRSGPRLRSRRLDLLFATERFRNREIALPASIAELFRQQQHQQQHRHRHEPSSRPDPETLPGDESPRWLVAGPGVDLTGRWRPVAASVDALAYDAFLVACCSGEVSYWTRRLLVSSPIVSRQELVVEQSDGGRFLRLVDVHPLVTEAWNRTLATAAESDFDFDSDSDSDFDTRSNGTYTNRLIDPAGDPISVDAFWQAGGRVHTAITRRGELALEPDPDPNPNRDRKPRASPPETGWFHVHSYLEGDATVGGAPASSSLGPSRVLIVETTHHSSAFPSGDEEELARLTRWEGPVAAPRKSHGDGDSYKLFGTARDRDGTATTMVWRWEEVPEPAL